MKWTLCTFAMFVCISANAQSWGPKTPCGVERWGTKTLLDPDAASLLSSDAKDATIAALNILQVPSGKELLAATSKRFPLEKQWGKVRVPALLIGYKQETGTRQKPGDFDFHIVLRDPKNPKMTAITELPWPACAPPQYRNVFAQLQARFIHDFGRPSGGSLKMLPKPILIHATGLVFFDVPHHDVRKCLPGESPSRPDGKCTGQDGVAKNGVELHPLLDWTID